MRHFQKSCTVFFLLLSLLLPLLPAARAEGGSTVLEARYKSQDQTVHTLQVAWSEAYFDTPATQYNHALARASLGLALAASRNDPETKTADADIISFLAQAGFRDIETTWYDRAPETDSLATCIAHLPLDGKELVVCVPCGQGYGAEWISNLTVGTGERSQGFQQAAELAESRIRDYLERQELGGTLYLWMAGFSRAAAVTNLTAADMTDSGLFDQVYAYCFACPRTTRAPAAYENIYCIVGQNDPVTMVPLAGWGFDRYGITLYTPAQESCSDYLMSSLSADTVWEEKCGTSFRNNPELNRQLHMVLEYLLEIFPTAEDYARELQPAMIAAWQDHGAANLLALLQSALSGSGMSAQRQKAAAGLRSFISSTLFLYLGGNVSQKSDGSWDDSLNTTGNLMLEHLTDVYVSWMFSDLTPEELFSGGTETTRFLLGTSVNSLLISDEYGWVQSLDADGEEHIYQPGNGNRSENGDLVYLYTSVSEGRVSVSLPRDRDYDITFEAAETGLIFLLCADYNCTSLQSAGNRMVLLSVEAGKEYTVRLDDDAEELTLTSNDGSDVLHLAAYRSEYDLNSILTMESVYASSSSLREIALWMALPAAVIVLTLIAAAVLTLLRRHGRIRRPLPLLPAVCAVIAAALLAQTAVLRHLLPAVGSYGTSLAAAAAIILAAGIGSLLLRMRSRNKA